MRELEICPSRMSRINRRINAVLKDIPGASLKVIRCQDAAFESVEAAVHGELADGGLSDAFLGANELIALATLAVLESADTGCRRTCF